MTESRRDGAAPARLRCTVNGLGLELAVGRDALLLDVLRDTLKLKGTRFGCGLDQCGACHVLIDGRAVAACATPMGAVEGRHVVTVEGLGLPGLPPGLREAFAAERAAQCGYCSSGLLIGAAALLLREPDPSEAQVRQALDPYLCRCGAHPRVVRAVRRAAAGMQAAGRS